MTFEFKKIIEACALISKLNKKAVLATVVCVEGSSYRREGVRMLVLEDKQMIGAISGGCVEKEVARQAESVFQNGKSKMMTYDGRYRLGCEGILYVLLELFEPEIKTVKAIQDCFQSRTPFLIKSYYVKEHASQNAMGSLLEIAKDKQVSFSKETQNFEELNLFCFTEKMKPCFRLIIVGAEHDAVKLCEMAILTGWEVTLVCAPSNPKTKNEFPGVSEIIASAPENFSIGNLDMETAVILMTHNFAKDVLFLKALRNTKPCYIGLLGPASRREKLLDAFIEYHPEVTDTFLETIHGPAGLNIGAETPQEIALSILAEILSVVRNEKVIPLQDKKGGIHSTKKEYFSILKDES